MVNARLKLAADEANFTGINVQAPFSRSVKYGPIRNNR